MSIKKVVHTKQIILYLDTNPIKYIQFSSVFMKNKLVWISIFAISMAFLESTIVVYLRELYYQDNIQNIFPLKFLTQINYSLEIGREISTLLMIFSVAVLVSGVSISKAFITFLYIFGFWDIFYYIWLNLIIVWPVSLFEWDVLFLVPSIWLAPWICPVLISLVFVIWSLIVLQYNLHFSFSYKRFILFIIGSLLDFTAFLQPGIAMYVEKGQQGLVEFKPDSFWWELFLLGYFLIIVSLISQISFNKKIMKKRNNSANTF